jgi:hypothetical protein
MDSVAVPALRYKKTNLVSFEFFEACQYVRIFIYSLQFLTYLVLVYAIMKKSPLGMGAYKW